jgi:Leucine-rich repeat (LRR) protein
MKYIFKFILFILFSLCSSHNHYNSNIYNIYNNKINELQSNEISNDNIILTSSGCNGTISNQEYIGLYSIYNSTNGQSWVLSNSLLDLSLWHFPTALDTPCTDNWQGLVCELSNNAAFDCIITALILNANLTGYIPSDISNLNNLKTLKLDFNNISSTIPDELYSITTLNLLWLNNNLLTGTISNSVLNLVNLEVLFLFYNNFHGYIPSSLYTITSLTNFGLGNNNLTGTIDPSISNLKALQVLSINDNNIYGSIPNSLYQMTQLSYLLLNNNHLTGFIDESISNLVLIERIFLNMNLFQGFIPNSIAFLTRKLTDIDLSHNKFTGSIPEFIGNLSNMQQLDLSHNYLNSTIPSSIGNCTSLIFLILKHNLLTKSIPNSIGNLDQLQYLQLNNNILTNSIPTAIGGLTSLLGLFLELNQFCNPIPTEIGLIANLTYLYLQENMFSSSLPSELGKLKYLEQASLGSNLLSGVLPHEISQLFNLNILNLSHNLFHGSMEHIWTNGSFGSLENIDISFNGFTGSLDSSMYNVNLTIINLIDNCFCGSVPEGICLAETLQILALDLVSSGSQCKKNENYIFYNILSMLFETKSYLAEYSLTSGIPDCLWLMPHLTTLHLSGNELTGTLGDILSSSQLKDINIANNALTGTLPLSWQNNKNFMQLDISNNKLSGILQDDFYVYDSEPEFILSISLNRFSGDLPHRLLDSVYTYNSYVEINGSNDAYVVNVLDGNLFNCDQSLIPPYENYICGSYDFDYALLSSTCVFFIVFIFIVFIFIISPCLESYKQAHEQDKDVVNLRMASVNMSDESSTIKFDIKQLKSETNVWRFVMMLRKVNQRVYLYWKSATTSDNVNLSLPNCELFLNLLDAVTKCAFIISTLFVLVCMICYILLKQSTYYSTIEYQYTWMSSSLFLHGAVPAFLVMFFSFLSSFYTIKTFCFTLFYGAEKVIEKEESFNDRLPIDFKRKFQENIFPFILMCLIQFINLLVTYKVNELYISELLYGVSLSEIFELQAALGLFKLVWNRIYVYWALQKVTESHPEYYSAEILFLNQLFMSITNFVAGPLLVTFFTDINCFRYYFQG